jgi:hypothetical protein
VGAEAGAGDCKGVAEEADCTGDRDAQRKRERDGERGEAGALGVRALLAVTLSQRGSQKLYEHDLVDMLVLLVRHLAAASRLTARVCGVCSYKISAPMYTVAFSVARQPGLIQPLRAPPVHRESTGGGALQGGLTEGRGGGPAAGVVGGVAAAEARVGGGVGEAEERRLQEAMEEVEGPVGRDVEFVKGEWRVLQGVRKADYADAAARFVANVSYRVCVCVCVCVVVGVLSDVCCACIASL